MSKSSKKSEVVVKEVSNYDNALSNFKTMSAKIRFLNAQNLTPGNISKVLTQFEGKNIRYQWVRNVLNTPVTTPKEVIA